MVKKSNIVLIGLMGAGKTSVGKILSKELNLDFIDIDELIEERQNTKISEIFKHQGEPFFRQLEVNTIKEVSKLSNKIISTGGGAPENIINIENLSQNGILFYLYAPVEKLYKRLLKEIENRPMLHNADVENKLKELLHKREPFYLKADYKIITTSKAPSEIVKEILHIFNGA